MVMPTRRSALVNPHADIAADPHFSGSRERIHALARDLEPGTGDPHRLIGPHPKRSEEHTSELQSRPHLVCRLLLEKKKKRNTGTISSTDDEVSSTNRPNYTMARPYSAGVGA